MTASLNLMRSYQMSMAEHFPTVILTVAIVKKKQKLKENYEHAEMVKKTEYNIM